MTQNYNILCCDGGGIRGLLTALLLHDLPPSAITNTVVFAGTSTGGILSIALSAGVEVQKLVELYSTHCGMIFSPSLSPAASKDQIKQYVRSFANPIEADVLLELVDHHILPINFFAAKYDPSGLRAAITEALGAQVSTRVSELARKLFITTFQFDRNGSWSPISFDNLDPASNDATLLDAALCTSAAEGFFPPHKHPTLGYCVDGGIFANNPATFVIARALQIGVDPKTIRMLSIGTGAVVNAVPSDYFDAVPPELWGLYQWLFPVKAPQSVGHMPLLTAMSGGSSEVNDEQAASILGSHYARVEVPLTRPITLDSCAEVPVLSQLASDYIAGAEWANVKKWVTENFV
jgi:hypothetical protein